MPPQFRHSVVQSSSSSFDFLLKRPMLLPFTQPPEYPARRLADAGDVRSEAKQNLSIVCDARWPIGEGAGHAANRTVNGRSAAQACVGRGP